MVRESEKDTERYLKIAMLMAGGKSRKWVCPAENGVPDQICIFPSGVIVFVEVKSEGKVPEDHQLRMHKRLRNMNCFVEVADTKAEVDTMIKKYRNKTITYGDQNE